MLVTLVGVWCSTWDQRYHDAFSNVSLSMEVLASPPGGQHKFSLHPVPAGRDGPLDCPSPTPIGEAALHRFYNQLQVARSAEDHEQLVALALDTVQEVVRGLGSGHPLALAEAVQPMMGKVARKEPATEIFCVCGVLAALYLLLLDPNTDPDTGPSLLSYVVALSGKRFLVAELCQSSVWPVSAAAVETVVEYFLAGREEVTPIPPPRIEMIMPPHLPVVELPPGHLAAVAVIAYHAALLAEIDFALRHALETVRATADIRRMGGAYRCDLFACGPEGLEEFREAIGGVEPRYTSLAERTSALRGAVEGLDILLRADAVICAEPLGCSLLATVLPEMPIFGYFFSLPIATAEMAWSKEDRLDAVDLVTGFLLRGTSAAGHGVAGEGVLGCLTGVGIPIVWATGQYQMVPPYSPSVPDLVVIHRRNGISKMLMHFLLWFDKKLGVGFQEESVAVGVETFSAVVFFPWSSGTMALVEYYAACIPLFLPAWSTAARLAFGVDLEVPGFARPYVKQDGKVWFRDSVARHCVDTQRCHLDLGHPESYLETNVLRPRLYYHQFDTSFVWPHIQRFESVADLVEQVARVDYRTVSRRMKIAHGRQVALGAAWWRTCLATVVRQNVQLPKPRVAAVTGEHFAFSVS
mmetsp:Transcript_1523/g.3130  ORF Transcript_1523/g.3130 Transcript_1523/m.3130 type:complete len:638 (-) Transcript_1523:133-2046(-)